MKIFIKHKINYLPGLLISFIFYLGSNSYGQSNFFIEVKNNLTDVKAFVFSDIIHDPTEKLTITDLLADPLNFNLKKTQKFEKGPIYWSRIKLYNPESIETPIYITIPFSDTTYLFLINNGIVKKTLLTGDQVAFKNRDVLVGQICILKVNLPKKSYNSIYLKTINRSSLSRKFQNITLSKVKLDSDISFQKNYIKVRSFHYFFYGGLIIMLLFNTVILVSIKSKDYFYYIFYLFFLSIFFLSNQGYFLETFLDNYPTLDLYIRFFSTPLLLIFYILFSSSYIKFESIFSVILNIFIALQLIFIGMMALGYWSEAKTCVIFSSIAIFLFIIYTAIITYKRNPQVIYFLTGNLFLIVAATLYAIERFFTISNSSDFTLLLQVAILFEIIFFSLGLANRIKTSEEELASSRIEQEKREIEIEKEKILIIEEKNKQLLLSNKQLDGFIYRTAHDIRGPLASIMGLCQIALMEVKESSAITYFNKLINTANKLDYILNRLYKAYQINNTQISNTIIDIPALVNTIVEDVKKFETIADDAIIFEVENINFKSDYALLHNIILNTLENALKFKATEYSDHKVWLTVIFKNDFLIINIADNGHGVPDEDIPFIFDLFSKAASRYKSPGIGLFLTRTSLLKLNGEITYSRMEGKTKFSISIPATL